jgi:hypothetical protein
MVISPSQSSTRTAAKYGAQAQENVSNSSDDDDLDSFHDCLSKIDSMTIGNNEDDDDDDGSIFSSSYCYQKEEETTSLLHKSPQRRNYNTSSTSYHLQSDSTTVYNSMSSSTPLRRNSGSNGDSLLQSNSNNTPAARNSSPLVKALSSWISPYYVTTSQGNTEGQQNKVTAQQQHNLNDNDCINNTTTATATPRSVVKFDTKNLGSKKRNGTALLHRAISSPALMSGMGSKMSKFNDIEEDDDERQRRSSAIVLKEIDADFNDSSSDDVIHPWTKLILLEELGTAWSWFVLLLPYAVMVLAVVLDGDPQLKYMTVGPLSGNNSCANVVNGSMPSTFDVSAKGYFPVPFRSESSTTEVSLSSSCSYPFELREGVGLLAHGMSPEFNSTVLSSAATTPSSGKSSIIDARYRHLMSHGSAFTSGVISNVPATSQSLQGVAKFNDLSNEAVAMVARGSVLVSAIVFQRQSLPGDVVIVPSVTVTGAMNKTEMKAEEQKLQQRHSQLKEEEQEHELERQQKEQQEQQQQQQQQQQEQQQQQQRSLGDGVQLQRWSPVLILNPKRLDMFCKLRRKGQKRTADSIDVSSSEEPIRWDCTSRHIVDAFFSLPNTAVLMGGDLRVDVLLSYRVPHTSTGDGALWMNEVFPTAKDINDDYFSYDTSGDNSLSEAEKLLSTADISNHKSLLAEISQKSVYKLEHESVAYDNVVEITRIITFIITLAFLCYWCLSMMAIFDDNIDCSTNNTHGEKPLQRFKQKIHFMWKQIGESHFWWESPWVTFPERRYLQLLLICLMLLQNPLLSYAYFHPSLYSSTRFRCIADSLSGISIQGFLFLWLCLVHGLRYQ